MNENKGIVVQAVGPVIDVRFKDEHLPELLTALKVSLPDGKNLTLEVAQHIGDDIVRCIAMGPTEGITRGLEVVDTNAPISVPVGPETLGRMFNILGEPIDEKEPIKTKLVMPIHRKAPAFKDQNVSTEMLETGIKVIDLLCPYLKGGKVERLVYSVVPVLVKQF